MTAHSDGETAPREGSVFPAAVPDVASMTLAERGQLLAQAVGLKRRLEARQRDGLLRKVDAARLRVARLTLAALEELEIAVPGTNMTLDQARARRKELRAFLGSPRRRLPQPSQFHGMPDEAKKLEALRELRAIEAAITRGNDRQAVQGRPRAARAQPRRITSVVQGGAPGLGKRN